MKIKTKDELLLHIEDLEMRLEEAEETLRAIRMGEVDALLFALPDSFHASIDFIACQVLHLCGDPEAVKAEVGSGFPGEFDEGVFLHLLCFANLLEKGGDAGFTG